MEKHRISFTGVETGWHNALPLGNGRMGAMVYYRDGKLCIALNHYDCYYHVLPQYAKQTAPAEDTADAAVFRDPARREKTYGELRRIVDRARKDPGYERSHYLRTLNPEQAGRPVYGGGSYPQGGEVRLALSEKADRKDTVLELCVEEGRVRFSAGKGRCRAEAEVWADPDRDGILIQLSQSEAGLWDSGSIWRQEARGQGCYVYENGAAGEAVTQTCLFRPDGEPACTEPFVQETALYIPGSSGGRMPEEWQDIGGNAQGQAGKEKQVCVLTASVQPGRGSAVRLAEQLWECCEDSRIRHREKWQGFWRSSVRLPDRYLETLWHLYVYLMECGSGAGGRHSEQACGLSGPWDIRRPCMWGSMWYWDVNIQTAFYGSFASNHMEQVKVFCDAFLSYREDAFRFAERIYGERGWALDYPHPLYNCIQPWCGLFLWQYYAYTQDTEFLREKAYPAFCGMLEFYRQITVLDENGIRHIEYDICPEQGPVTKDSTITTAAVKQLAVYALRAAGILGRPEEEQEEIARLIRQMPDYAKTKDGSRWKDSTLVQDDIFLRHPSVLMPVFPAEEVHMESRPALRETAGNTIRYAAENTEAGTFGFEWIAAAAARMGAGESALRILYEKGLDLMTHSNGLGYEESERFINYCHLTKPANYLPVMCEEAGGTAAVINMLLLQEIDGVIHVFPAVPDGEDRYAGTKTEYYHDDRCVSAKYGPWKDVSFEGMLAPGGFEVSAQMRDGRTVWIRIKCRVPGKVRIAVPESLVREAECHAGLHAGISQDSGGKICEAVMEAGGELSLGVRSPETMRETGGESGKTEVLVHRAARTHRRTFIGEDRDTRFYKAVDSMVCPYGYAEGLHYGMTPYVFDLTGEQGKNYDDVYEKQIIEAGRAVLCAGGPRPVGAEIYTADRGYGFLASDCGGIRAKDQEKDQERGPEKDRETGCRIVRRQGPDSMRRDFAEGAGDAVFGVELPAGKYDILVVSGDEEEPSVTDISVPQCGVCLPGEEMDAGEYQCRIIPVMHREDGILRIVLSTGKGRKWKMNAVFINKQYMLL